MVSMSASLTALASEARSEGCETYCLVSCVITEAAAFGYGDDEKTQKDIPKIERQLSS